MSISLEHFDGSFDTLHGGRYWSEVLYCTIMNHLDDLEVKVTDLEILRSSFSLKFL